MQPLAKAIEIRLTNVVIKVWSATSNVRFYCCFAIIEWYIVSVSLTATAPVLIGGPSRKVNRNGQWTYNLGSGVNIYGRKAQNTRSWLTRSRCVQLTIYKRIFHAAEAVR